MKFNISSSVNEYKPQKKVGKKLLKKPTKMNYQNNDPDYIQKENEGFLEFAKRLETLWDMEKEITIEIFFKVFIEGIRDTEVKINTKRWFEEVGNTEIFKNFVKEKGYLYTKIVIDVVEKFQKEKDEKTERVNLIVKIDELLKDEYNDDVVEQIQKEKDKKTETVQYSTVKKVIAKIDEVLKQAEEDMANTPINNYIENVAEKIQKEKDKKPETVKNLIAKIDESLKQAEEDMANTPINNYIEIEDESDFDEDDEIVLFETETDGETEQE